MKAEIWCGTLKGAKIGLVAGFPTFFAIVPALQWLGIQGGMREGVAIVLLTLSLNGALWGAVIGAAITLRSSGHRRRILY